MGEAMDSMMARKRAIALVDSFKTTYWLINQFAEEMSHGESLATPDFPANSFNWVLGHLLVSRDRVLLLLGVEPLLDELTTALYQTGANPVTEATAVELADLLLGLGRGQSAILARLETISAEELAKIVDPDSGATLIDSIAGLHWHETYHTGQLEILRQVAVARPFFP